MKPSALFILLIFSIAILQCTKIPPLKPGSTYKVVITVQGQKAPLQTTMLYSIPPQYDPNIPAPLLVALHGYGDNAAAFHDLWKAIADSLGFVLLTPQGDVPVIQNIGWGWSAEAEKIILASLDVVQRNVFIHPGEIFMAGFSMGGSLCYRIGLKHPEIFSGIAALGAPFDTQDVPKILGKPKDFKVYIGHGELDNHLAEARSAFELLSENKMDVQLHIYPNIGHTIPQPMKQELSRILIFLQSNKID